MPVIDCFGRKVYGPYIDTCQVRRLVSIIDNGNKRVMSYARWMMECHLGRRLERWEEVDHKDEDKLNDVISNFQILTKKENTSKSAKKPEMFKFKCPVCGNEAEKRMRHVKHNKKYKHSGPYCSRSCGSYAGRMRQLGKSLPVCANLA